MTNWAGDDGLAFLSNMLIGQGDIVSAEPARLIRDMGAMVRDRPDIVKRLAAGDRTAVDAMPELRAAFDAYIAKFGDRCTQELKLESRSLHEDPAQVLMAIAAAAAPRAASNAAPEAARDLDDLIAAAGQAHARRLAAEMGQGPRARPGESALRAHAPVRPGAAHLPRAWARGSPRPACCPTRATSSTSPSTNCSAPSKARRSRRPEEARGACARPSTGRSSPGRIRRSDSPSAAHTSRASPAWRRRRRRAGEGGETPQGSCLLQGRGRRRRCA